MIINDKQSAVYDIEVVDGYLILSYIADNKTITLTNPTRPQVAALFDKYTMVGFNNQGYDDKILNAYVTSTQDLKTLSDGLINGTVFLPRSSWHTLDLRHLLLNHHPSSLKKWESALGLPIHQAEEYFNLPAHLQNVDHLVEYCESDVQATKAVLDYLVKDGSFEAYRALCEYVEDVTGIFVMGSRNYMTKLLLTPMIGESTHYNHKNLADYLDSCDIKYKLPLYDKYIKLAEIGGVLDADLDIMFSSKRISQRGKYKPFVLTTEEWDAADQELGDYIASKGGAHYFNDKVKHSNTLLGMDISSLYPSVMVKLNLFGDLTAKLDDLMQLRLASKKTNKTLANGLKLAINSLYGITRSETAGEHLYTKFGVDTCLVGNVLFYDLLRRCEDYGITVAQINTDGIFVVADDNAEMWFTTLIRDFEKRTGLLAEQFELNNYYALDVNNYFCDEKAKGVFADNKELRDLKAIPKIAMAELRGETPKLDVTDLMRRATATGKWTHARFDYEMLPRISEKTGKVLKGYELVYTNPEPIGKTIRGYVSKYKQSTIIARTDGVKQTKVSKVDNTTFVCCTVMPITVPLDLDYDWYKEEAAKLIAKIKS